MYFRTVFKALEDHLTTRQITVITGMRRIGKSTAVKWLLERVKHDNKIYLDCERIEIRNSLNQISYKSVEDWLVLEGLDLKKPCVIALDEIQLVQNLPSLIKYLYDTFKIKFIVTGSSSYYMKNQFSESLAGRKRIFEMYPLNVPEFLSFKEVETKPVEQYKWTTFSKPWHDRFEKLYEEYILYGGFPEVVLHAKVSDKKEYLRDIINSYIELDVKLLSDFSISDDLYRLAKLLAARSGNKIDYSKLGSVLGLHRQKVKAYIDLFEYTYLIYQVRPYSKNIDREILTQPKLYFSDTGILNELAGAQISSGQLFENAIAAQLKPQGVLNYYQRKNGQEIDFILDESMAIEVKETVLETDWTTLSQRSKSIGLKNYHLISRHVNKSRFRDFIWGGNIF